MLGPSWLFVPCTCSPGLSRYLRLECAVGLALTNHGLAVGIEGIVDNPFRRILLMIILVAQMPEAFGNSVESRSFRLMPERIVGISAIDNFSQQYQSRVRGQVILLEDDLKRAGLALVSQFHALHIIGYRPFLLSNLQHRICWAEDKFGLPIHKLRDEPGAGHSVHFATFPTSPIDR